MFTCISCRVAFEDASEQRAHFSTDWHRYNMKRRVANLPPVAAAAFNDKVIERREQNAVRTDPRGMACEACGKSFATENAYRSHIQSKKHREREYAFAVARASGVTEQKDLSAQSQRPSSRPTEVEGEELSEHEETDREDDVGDIEDRLAASRRRRFLPTDCLFCSTRSTTIENSLQHMLSAHSFFIPDREVLIDLPGLLSYLGEKVVIGNICLFCPGGAKEFGTVEAVRRHMIDKGHCKVAFETDEDRAELADYYSFELIDDDDAWEDLDEEGDQMMDDRREGRRGIALSEDGLSLVLPSGRVLGHRALRVYYAQRLRPVSDSPSASDTSVSKLARVKERLADPSQALITVGGGTGGYGRGLEVMNARNAGEAKWANKQAHGFRDQKARQAHQTKMGFKHNNQKHFRDPLCELVATLGTDKAWLTGD